MRPKLSAIAWVPAGLIGALSVLFARWTTWYAPGPGGGEGFEFALLAILMMARLFSESTTTPQVVQFPPPEKVFVLTPPLTSVWVSVLPLIR